MQDAHSVEDLLPLAPRDFLILFALVDGEQHGYGLVKAVERDSDRRVRMDPANLYRALRRLARSGLVHEVRHPRLETARRRTYRLTTMGRDLVAAEARRLERLTAAARAKELIPSVPGK